MSDRGNLVVSGLLAATVVVLALAVKAGQPRSATPFTSSVVAHHGIGAIVIEREALHATLRGRSTGPAVQATTIVETSRLGRPVAVFSAVDFGTDLQLVEAGNALQFYVPRDNTVYVTTEKALAAAQQAQLGQAPSSPQAASASGKLTAAQGQSAGPGPSAAPGWRSSYLQGVLDHTYRIVGETRIGGRAVLELTPRAVAPHPDGPGSKLSSVVYVSPGTLDPVRSVVSYHVGTGAGDIESVNGLSAPELKSITDWQEYRVLPATPANQRLLSLTARHPSARISHSATAYVSEEASASRSESTHVTPAPASGA